MNPGLKSSVEEFLPIRADLENQRSAKKQMFIAKAGSYATEIEQVPAEHAEKTLQLPRICC